jgi:hypothetical protein
MRIYFIALLFGTVLVGHSACLLARPMTGLSEAALRQRLHSSGRNFISARLMNGTRTLEARSLSELVAWTAPVSAVAPQRYDFQSYFRAANLHGQRSGKTLEAVFAWRANQHAIRQGLPNRFLVTAAEGFHTHAADLVEVVDGQAVASYQAKLRLNLKSASRYLVDPRYEGMRLLTTRESHNRVVRELAKREASALRRGVPLAQKWQRVRDAIDSGGLPARFAGRPLPTLRGTNSLTQRTTKAQFVSHLRVNTNMAAHSHTLGIARVAGRTLVAGDFIFVTYFQYKDTRRLMAGEIQGDMYAARTTLRGVQSGLAV